MNFWNLNTHYQNKKFEKSIDLDCNLLLRFLKENHIMKLYFKKCNITFNYIDAWKQHIKQNNSSYISHYIFNNIYDFVIDNESLFRSEVLFARWINKPYILTDNSTEEYLKWENLSKQYIIFKQFYFKDI